MAKKKAANQKSWPEQVEQACRDAVSAIPGFQEATSEHDWCDAVSEGLGLYKDSIDARLDELTHGDD
jgi:hypothetical protein